MREAVDDRFGASGTSPKGLHREVAGGNSQSPLSPSAATLSALSSIVFLRFLVPALSSPSVHGLLASPPPRAAARGLVLVSKVVLAVANGVPFGTKEPYMVVLNPIVEGYIPKVETLLVELAGPSGASSFESLLRKERVKPNRAGSPRPNKQGIPSTH